MTGIPKQLTTVLNATGPVEGTSFIHSAVLASVPDYIKYQGTAHSAQSTYFYDLNSSL